MYMHVSNENIAGFFYVVIIVIYRFPNPQDLSFHLVLQINRELFWFWVISFHGFVICTVLDYECLILMISWKFTIHKSDVGNKVFDPSIP